MTEEVINKMTEALTALGQYWRNDWSDFDGRTLRDQLSNINYILYEHNLTDEDKIQSYQYLIDDWLVDA